MHIYDRKVHTSYSTRRHTECFDRGRLDENLSRRRGYESCEQEVATQQPRTTDAPEGSRQQIIPNDTKADLPLLRLVWRTTGAWLNWLAM